MSSLSFLDDLLNGSDVEWTPLGKICHVLRGKRLTKSMLSNDGNYPVFHGGLEPLGYFGEFNRAADTIMIINVGASAGTVGYRYEEFWSSDGCFCLSPTSKMNSRFLYHFLVTCEPAIKGKVRVAGIPTLDAIVLEQIRIPVPCPEDTQRSLAVQAEIARILDRFAELAAELAAELTAELNARRKQYEYYRAQLLSFPKREEATEA